MMASYSHSMDDILFLNMQIKIEENIGEALVEMSSKAHVQLLYLAKEYERKSQQWSVLRKMLQILSKDKQKSEEITLEHYTYYHSGQEW